MTIRRVLSPIAAFAALALMIGLAPSAGAQKAAAMPEVGAVAPNFTLPGASRYGLLQDSVSLSDYRGKTVVLAFFFKARTKG
jgi:hypothetical protein